MTRIGRRSVALVIWCTIAVLLAASGLVHAQDPGTDDKSKSTPEPEATEVRVPVVEGQVTDAAGSGQADVAVSLHAKQDDGTRGPTLAEATTNHFGDFTLELPDRPSGDYLILFQKPQHEDLVHEVALKKDGVIPFVAASLHGNIVLKGRVLGEPGAKPVPKATVMLQTVSADRRETTDDEGNFTFKQVAPGRATLVVEADGFGRHQQQVIRTEDAGDLSISVKPQRVVRIVVKSDAGEPISGASVEILDRPRDDMRAAVTGEDGSVTFGGLHFDAAELLARASHPNYVSGVGFDQRIDLPADQAESQHEIVLPRAGALRIAVVNFLNSKPIYGARVMTGERSNDDTPRDWTNDEGVAEIVGLAPGKTVVTVHARGYAPALAVMDVELGKPAEQTLALKPGQTIAGQVVDETGKGVAGAEIIAGSWRSYNTLGLRAMTNMNGEFVIEDAPSDPFEAFVEAPGAARKRVEIDPDEDPLEIDLNLAVLRKMAESQDKSDQPKVGDAPPALTVTTLSGKKINFSQLRDKTVVVDFWATWCTPCVQELPMVISLAEKYKDRRDFMILGISRDFAEGDLRSFLTANPKVAWDQVISAGGTEEAVEQFGVVGIPSIFVIGPDGKIAASDIRAGDLESTVKVLLGAKD